MDFGFLYVHVQNEKNVSKIVKIRENMKVEMDSLFLVWMVEKCLIFAKSLLKLKIGYLGLFARALASSKLLFNNFK